MAITRGFVRKIEIGRAGLVTVSLIQQDGSNADYIINDLDADPERFNERLSKLAVLRDAMNRAEPVEIDHFQGDAGEIIDSAARISRDALGPVANIELVVGLVGDVLVTSTNGIAGAGEIHDRARVAVVTLDLQSVTLLLDLQAPERLVADQQLEMILAAQAQGSLVRFIVDPQGGGESGTDNTRRRIIAVAVEDDISSFGGENAHQVSGFVETLSLIRIPGVGGELAGKFAHVRFTTAPDFTGPGNTVSVSPFSPATIDLLVPKHSPAYDLFEAGLRDNLRMRISAVLPGRTPRNGNTPDEGDPTHGDSSPADLPSGGPEHVSAAAADFPERNMFAVVLAVELLAPLASASRPVWLQISREALDYGPDGPKCAVGVPSSDLTPMTLRDLRIPYPAAWKGLACFNKGIYRFQLRLPSKFKIVVDGKELCLYDSDQEGTKFAYVCFCEDCCEHMVIVEIDAWTCEDEFIMDVYRLR
jgi:hypothetical protein